MRHAPKGLRRALLVLLVSAVPLLFAPATASAIPGFSVEITGPGTGSVGKPLSLKAAGKDPSPAESWFQYYLQVEAIPAAIVPSCPPDYLQAVQLSGQTEAAGGDHLVGPQYHLRDAAGYWSAPFAYTPSAQGRFLICAYTQNLSSTQATDQLTVQVAASGRKKCKKPRRAKRRSATAARKCAKRR